MPAHDPTTLCYTIGQLRKQIKDLPDDTIIVVPSKEGYGYHGAVLIAPLTVIADRRNRKIRKDDDFHEAPNSLEKSKAKKIGAFFVG